MGSLAELTASYSRRSIDVASAPGWRLLGEGSSLGHPAEKPLFASTFDGDVLLATGAPREAREQQLACLVEAATEAALQVQLDALDAVLVDITTQGGGTLRYRTAGGLYPTTYRVAAAKRGAVDMAEYERFQRARVTISLVVEAYGHPAPLDIIDTFSTDTFGTGGILNPGGADWARVGAPYGQMTVSGGAVIPDPAMLGGFHLSQLTATDGGWGSRDFEVALKHTTGASVSSYFANIGLLGTGININAQAEALALSVMVGGGTPVTGAITLAANTSYWLVLRRQGPVLVAEHWTAKPTPMGTPAQTATIVIGDADSALLAATATRPTINWVPVSSGARLDDFRVRALTYKGVACPAVLRLEGAWGGTTDALAGIYFTGSGGTAPATMLYAWWPRVPVHNYVDKGAAEIFSSAAVANGWTAAAVTNITNAATSVARQTSNVRSGTGAYEAVCPATAASGVAYPIYRRGGFRKGVTYTAQMWVRASSGTTTVRARLGTSADVATGTASALSTTWTPRTVTWTPNADADVAYVAIGIGAATATTFQFDDVLVFEGTQPPTFEAGGHGPGIIAANIGNTIDGDGAYWSAVTDANYLIGMGLRGSGSMGATASIRYPILPHLFEPDDYTSDEVDVAVYARLEVASTQTGLSCAISMASERGTSFGARRYGSFRAAGRAIKLPSSGTCFRTVYLGTVTLKVDRTRPRREWLKLTFTNGGGATGNLGIDYLVVVPRRSIASSRTGVAASVVPQFIASTAETTKVVGVSTDGEITGQLVGAVVEHANLDAFTPDDGLLGEPIRLPRDGAELLVWPSDLVIDATDSVASSNAKTHTGTVQVAVQPRVHLLRQS